MLRTLRPVGRQALNGWWQAHYRLAATTTTASGQRPRRTPRAAPALGHRAAMSAIVRAASDSMRAVTLGHAVFRAPAQMRGNRRRSAVSLLSAATM